MKVKLWKSIENKHVLYQSRLTLFSALSACTLVLCSATSSKANPNPNYNFDLQLFPLFNGCASPPSISPDCYKDQNVKRASGFSHSDGSGAPNLLYPIVTPFQDLLKTKSLWKRLYETSVSMHVIDKSKPKTLLEIVNGTEIYTDENFNSWRKFDGKWYVKMAHQFYMNDKQEGPLWCGAIPLCQGSDKDGPKERINVGVGGGPIFFAPILSENAPQAKKDKVNLGDWLRARPNEYDLTKPETVNARANFFVGGRGIGFYDDPNNYDNPLDYDPLRKDDALWNHVALVWVDPDQLFRPAQNPDISIANFATNVANHFDHIQGTTEISWCIYQFKNVITPSNDVDKCDPADGKVDEQGIKIKGDPFKDFREYYLSYFNAGSNPDNDNFFPFPFTGLGVTYDPYYQALLESSTTESQLSAIVSSLIGTSEFVYSIPESGKSSNAKMYLDAVYPIISTVTVPGPLPILGLGASFAFTRRLRRRIRLGRRMAASHRF